MLDSRVGGPKPRCQDLQRDGPPPPVVMLFHFLSGVSFGQNRALPEWLALKTNRPAAMEAAVPRGRPEGPAGSRGLPGAQGCTSRPWPREPGLWRFTTPSQSSRTASPSTDPSSSSARITSYGNTRRRSPNGHILSGLRSPHSPHPLQHHIYQAGAAARCSTAAFGSTEPHFPSFLYSAQSDAEPNIRVWVVSWFWGFLVAGSEVAGWFPSGCCGRPRSGSCPGC